MNANERKLHSETSPSVQTHLGILQNVIQRMSANSSSSKAWCIAVVSAILVVVADKGEPNFAYLALIPIILFLALDTYYLALEKAFRRSYNDFVDKLHSDNLQTEDLYSVDPSGRQWKHRIAALQSFPIWGFYVTLIVLVTSARYVILE